MILLAVLNSKSEQYASDTQLHVVTLFQVIQYNIKYGRNNCWYCFSIFMKMYHFTCTLIRVLL